MKHPVRGLGEEKVRTSSQEGTRAPPDSKQHNLMMFDEGSKFLRGSPKHRCPVPPMGFEDRESKSPSF